MLRSYRNRVIDAPLNRQMVSPALADGPECPLCARTVGPNGAGHRDGCQLSGHYAFGDPARAGAWHKILTVR